MVAPATPAVIGVRDAATRRRSIRAYMPDPIPRPDLEAILATARLAPSVFNLQPWRFVVVESPDVRAALAEAAYNQRQVSSAPAVIVLYTDTADALATVDEIIHPDLPEERRERTRASVRRAFAGKDDSGREALGSHQGYIALGYLLLAAEEQGYQTSPMLGFDAVRVKAVLSLPPHVQVAALVAIGRGAEDGQPHHRHALERIVKFV